MEVFDSIEQARLAKRKRDFPEAEKILKSALEFAIEPESREELLRQLFYLYFSPAYEDLELAQAYLTELDKLSPSAHNGMEWVLFFMNCKQDPASARKWADITVGRAESENAVSILYTATAFAGLLAAKLPDLQTVQSALRQLSSLVESGQPLPWGDEVAFLEACMSLSEEIRKDAKALAALTAPKIEDPEYRGRAEHIMHLNS